MEVLINTQIITAQITAAGIAVSLTNESITEAIIGIPGSPGANGTAGVDGIDGVPGAQGAPGAAGLDGTGLPVGGQSGQVPVKNSAADFDLAWSDAFKVDPSTGNIGIGTAPSTTTTRLSIQAVNSEAYSGQVLHLKNSNGTNLLTVSNDGLLQTIGGGLRVFPNGQASLGGLDFKLIGNVTFLNAYSSSNNRTVQLYNSFPSFKADLLLGDGRLRVHGTDDSYFTGNLGIGTQTPSTKLHVNGPARVGSYTVATMPGAASSGAGTIIYVSNETGGSVMAFSDGTDWRRMTDRAVVG